MLNSRSETGKIQGEPEPSYGAKKKVLKRQVSQKGPGANLKELPMAQKEQSQKQNK